MQILAAPCSHSRASSEQTCAGADLSDTDLSKTDFSGADLTGANLTHADLYDANLLGVKGLETVTGLNTVANLDKAKR